MKTVQRNSHCHITASWLAGPGGGAQLYLAQAQAQAVTVGVLWAGGLLTSAHRLHQQALPTFLMALHTAPP